LILNGWVAVRWGLAASFTCAVKRYGAVVDAVDVGVPLIAPVLRLNDKPGGRDPLEIDHGCGNISSDRQRSAVINPVVVLRAE
jgi:hypothetical protein